MTYRRHLSGIFALHNSLAGSTISWCADGAFLVSLSVGLAPIEIVSAYGTYSNLVLADVLNIQA